MDDKGLGNIIFYIILAIIGLVGSFSGKKKKISKPGVPKQTLGWPDFSGETTHSFPDVFDPEPETKPVQSPAQAQTSRTTFSPFDKDAEGRYEETMAGDFAGEGTYLNPVAERFSNEGSTAGGLAGLFSNEGSIEATMAQAFSTEGMSGMAEAQISLSQDTTISDGAIGDPEEFDYEAYKDDIELHSGFNIRRAVIYSAILNRKEYTF